jgi:uncharacterized membrane protein YeaQ/YmgE (transglycosylase-associated protein family)
MGITLLQLVVWLIIAAIVGVIGEALVHRRTPGGIVGAILLGWLAIFLVVGVFHFSIGGEPFWEGVPLISSILAAAIIVLLWSFIAYRRVAPYYARYRSRSYPRRRRFW